jgi:hypothetical protein
MPKRRPNHRLAKIHRNYTVEEIANLFGIHKNTVRRWIDDGLETLDQRRPLLVHGIELATYLRARRAKNKRPCQPGEIYCVRCRAPRRPAGDMADYLPITVNLGNLSGICPDCDSLIFRRVSRAKLPQVRGKLEVTILEAEPRVGGIDSSTVDGDFGEGEQP